MEARDTLCSSINNRGLNAKGKISTAEVVCAAEGLALLFHSLDFASADLDTAADGEAFSLPAGF